ncbi:MAG: aldo/keto reductase [Acidobacteriota bacterium]
MDYVSLGRSGLKVSPLCLGAMMFGAWGNRDHDDCVRIIHRALDGGINFIDTSNNYAEGESEQIVGKALKGRRDDVVVATKVWAPMGPGPNQRGLSRKAIHEQVEASLRRLDIDVIDLYQIHRPDPSVPWEETLEALTDLVRQGKVRYVRCSTNHYHDPGGNWGHKLWDWQLVETLWISERNRYASWTSLQPPYSILRRTMEAEHFPVCERFGIGCIVWSPLEGGWLTGKYRKGQPNPADSNRAANWVGDLDKPVFAQRIEIVESLIEIAESKNVPLARLANAWVLRHPAVTSAIIGPRTMEQLEDSLACLDVTFTDDELARIDALVPPGTSVL